MGTSVRSSPRPAGHCPSPARSTLLHMTLKYPAIFYPHLIAARSCRPKVYLYFPRRRIWTSSTCTEIIYTKIRGESDQKNIAIESPAVTGSFFCQSHLGSELVIKYSQLVPFPRAYRWCSLTLYQDITLMYSRFCYYTYFISIYNRSFYYLKSTDWNRRPERQSFTGCDATRFLWS